MISKAMKYYNERSAKNNVIEFSKYRARIISDTRNLLRMNRYEFAIMLGTSSETVKSWEDNASKIPGFVVSSLKKISSSEVDSIVINHLVRYYILLFGCDELKESGMKRRMQDIVNIIQRYKNEF